MTSIRTLVLSGAIVLAFAACSNEPETKAEALAADTTPHVEQGPAYETPQAAPDSTPPKVESRVAFNDDVYTHAAGEPFPVIATSYDETGSPVPGDMLRYTVEGDSVAWIVPQQANKPCKDYPLTDHHPYMVASSATPVWMCGQMRGLQTKITAESLSSHRTGESTVTIQ